MNQPCIVISVVSHRQGYLVRDLLKDIETQCDENIQVVLTLNVPEAIPFEPKDYKYPIDVVHNQRPKGFGANHNSAFRHVACDYFCVVNPDIRITANPFMSLIECLNNASAGVVGPLVRNRNGDIEDSARAFPTPWRIAKKLISVRAELPPGLKTENVRLDWVAGMFMLFPATVFRNMGGFDERYFLYYEDVDLCARLSLSGYSVTLCPEVEVIHDARRQSHREWRYLRWHIESMVRFFLSPVFRRVMWRKILNAIRNER